MPEVTIEQALNQIQGELRALKEILAADILHSAQIAGPRRKEEAEARIAALRRLVNRQPTDISIADAVLGHKRCVEEICEIVEKGKEQFY